VFNKNGLAEKMRHENERLAGGPARSFVELFQSSFAHGCFPRVRCATLGFVVERLRRIHAATQNNIEPLFHA